MSANPVPHPQFYYPTGDIVLHVEGTLFKVPKRALVDASPILKKMVDELEASNALLESENDSSSLPIVHDDCPKLHIPTDRAHDWHDMFCLLLGDNFYQQTLGRPPWRDINKAVSVTTSILRLSSRYRMAKQRSEAIEALKQVIPSEGFLHLATLNTRNEFFPTHKSTPRQVIAICREVGLKRFLPWAYYECARCSAGEITTFIDLTGEERTAILAGRDVVLQMQRQQIYRSFTFAFLPTLECSNKPPCQMDRSLVKKFDLLISQGVGPLILIDHEKIQDRRLCTACLNRAKREVRDGQRRLWENLPQIFGLGTWSTLHDHDGFRD